MKRIKRSKKALSPEKVRQFKALAQRVDHEEKEEVIALARRAFDRHRLLVQTVSELKVERERLGLTLEEVGRRSGIGKANLSRLENAKDPNPTIATLMRYAEALGKDILITLNDRRAG